MKTQILNLLTNSLRGQTTRKGSNENSIPSVSLRYPYRKMAVILLCLISLGVGQAWAKDIFINVSSAPSGYTSEMQVHYWGSGDSYVNASSTGVTNIWKATIPDGATGWQVCRGSGSNHYNYQNNGSGTNNLYSITGWNNSGRWSTIIGIVNSPIMYYDNSKTKWTGKIQFVVGHSSYSRTYTMTQLTGTELYYVNLGNETYKTWGDATYYAVISTSSKVEDGSWGQSSLSSKATNRTNAYTSSYSLNSGDRYLITCSSNQSAMTITYESAYTNMNYTQTVKATVKEVGGSSYSVVATAPTTLNFTTYNLTNWEAISTQQTNSYSSSKAEGTASRAALTTINVGSTPAGYEYAGIYTAQSGGTQLSDANTYTYSYYPQEANTYYVRWNKVNTPSVGLSASSTYLTTTSSARALINETITLTPAATNTTTTAKYKYEYSTNGGTTWNAISSNQTGNGSYKPTTKGDYKFRVTLTSESNNPTSTVDVHVTEMYTIQVKKNSSWTPSYLYVWNKTSEITQYGAWPGSTGKFTTKGEWYIFELNSDFDSFIVSASSYSTNHTADKNEVTADGCYAINSGTGISVSISSATCPSVPTVTVSAATSVTKSTATINGNVTALGNDKITDYGFYWGTQTTQANLVSSGTKISKGSKTATGTFTGSLTNLTAGTKYYFVAYATNGQGTSYSSVLDFTTLATYTITVNVASGQSSWGSVNKTSLTVSSSDGESVTATANTGFAFDKWTYTDGITLSATTATTTVKATKAGTLTANFKENSYTLTIKSSNAAFGTIKVGSGTATSQTTTTGKPVTASATLTAEPKTGATFTGWTIPTGVTLASGTSSSTSITVNATQAATITANFSETTYTVSLNSANTTQGTVSASSVTVGEITAVKITATPKSGYMFNGWVKSGSGTVTYYTAAGTGQTVDASGASKATTYITTTGTATLQATWAEDRSSGYYLRYGNDGKNADGGDDSSKKFAWTTNATDGVFMKKAGETTGTVSYFTLTASASDVEKVYEFKVTDHTNWYGYGSNSGGKIDASITDKVLDTNYGNGRLCIVTPGDYVFKWDSSTKKLSITFPAGNYIRGEFNSWGWSDALTGSGPYTATINLPADQLYATNSSGSTGFKYVIGGVHYGKNGTITASSNSLSSCTTDGQNMGLATTIGGDYTFTVNAAKTQVTVTYPQIPAMSGTLSLALADESNASGSAPVLKGSGTEADPYLVFKGKDIYVAATHNSKPATATDHIYYQFYKGGSADGTASTSTLTYNTTASEAVDDVKTIQVKAYYQYGPTGYKTQGAEIASNTVYYKVVKTPTVSLIAPTEVELNENISLTAVVSDYDRSMIATSEPSYEFQHRLGTTGDYGIFRVGSADSTCLNQSLTTPNVNQAGVYNFRVRFHLGGYDWYSETQTVTIATYYTIFIMENSNTPGWLRRIYAYGPNSAINAAYPGEAVDNCATKVEDHKWVYLFKYPTYDHIKLNGKGDAQDTSSGETGNIEITGPACITITGGSGTTWNYNKDDDADCGGTYYRVRSMVHDTAYFSNLVQQNGDKLSYYAHKDGTLTLEKLANGSWTTVKNLTSPTTSDVYVATYNNDNVQDIHVYTGQFYLYGKCESQSGDAKGIQTTPAEATADAKQAAHFTEFDMNFDLYPNDYYNNYWCAWVLAGKDVTGTVGNDYNANLSIAAGADEHTWDDGMMVKASDTEANNGACVRFAYNRFTNLFERTLVKGSTEDKFMYLYDNGQKTYSDKDGNNKVDTENRAITFSDLSDFQYQLDCYAQYGAEAVIIAQFPGRGTNKNTLGTAIKNSLFGQTGAGDYLGSPIFGDDAKNTEKIWHIRIIFDYKTNRIVTAWIVDEEELVEDDLILDANMMITRRENELQSTITIQGEKKISSVNKIYTVLEFVRESYKNRGKTGAYMFSLPYDCNVQDIFGIEGYGSKWIILTYDGEKRALNGMFSDSGTYWTPIAANGTLRKNQGYVVRINNIDTEFKEVEIEVLVNNVKEKQKKSIKRLYFPSNETGKSVLKNATEQSDVAEHICNITTGTNYDHRKTDTNWNLVGVPTYTKDAVATWKQKVPDADHDMNGHYDVSWTQFYYDYKAQDNNADLYTPTQLTNATQFQPTFAYLMQWAGTIDWNSNANTVLQTAAPQRTREQQAQRTIELELRDSSSMLDRTYIALEDYATTAYDLNLDLGKVFTAGFTQIYSIGAFQTLTDESGNAVQNSSNFAANCLPVETTTVPLGVRMAEQGEVTFRMTREVNGIIPVLNDKTEERLIDLRFSDYTATVAAGDQRDRFELQIEVVPVQEVATDLSQTSQACSFSVTQTAHGLLLNGVNDGAAVRLYDAAGKLLWHTESYRGETITAPAQGVYLLRADSETLKVVVR